MKNYSILFLFFCSSCISSRSLNFGQNIFDSNNNQILYYTKKPIFEYEEKGLVEVYYVSKKEKFVIEKLKEELKKNNYDAIIDIKTEVFAASYFLTTTRCTGIGIKYKK